MPPQIIGQTIDDLNQFAAFGKRSRASGQSGAPKRTRWLFALLATGLVTFALAAAVFASLSLL